MSIYDTMNYIKPDVCTICIGQAASMGAFYYQFWNKKVKDILYQTLE